MLYIILGFIVLGIIFFLINQNEQKSLSHQEKENIGKYYYRKKNFFTYREKPFFDELVSQNNGRYIILSKVRMEDVVGVAQGIEKKKYRPMRNHIKSRHLDFVLLGRAGEIVAVIELDDKSHNQERVKVGDSIKNQIFHAVEIPFFRVRVGENYKDKISEIFDALS